MTMRAYRFRIYPDPEQETQLIRTIGCSRKIYNLMLSSRIDLYQKFLDKEITEDELRVEQKKITPASYKEKHPYLKEVDSLALASEWTNLNNAYSNFFKRVRSKSGRKGFPRFKSKNRDRHSFKTMITGQNIRLDDRGLKLPKMKAPVRIVKHREVYGSLKSVTVTHERSGKWYVSILYDERDMIDRSLPDTGNAIGIDLGLTDFLVNSDGEKIDNPRIGRGLRDRLAKEQRKLSRKYEAAKTRARKNGEKLDLEACHNYQKQKRKVARVSEKIKNKRSDFLHQLSSMIVKNHDIIVCESLRSSNLVKNHSLAFSISDASWSEFVRQLEYKSSLYGRVFVKVDQYYPSSQICHACGRRDGKKSLDIREWVCPGCGAFLDRDVNAAINILGEGLRMLIEQGVVVEPWEPRG